MITKEQQTELAREILTAASAILEDAGGDRVWAMQLLHEEAEKMKQQTPELPVDTYTPYFERAIVWLCTHPHPEKSCTI